MSDIDDVVDLIEKQMNSGVSRLKVQTSEELSEGQTKKAYHLGRCDVGSPWAKGTVTNCDYVDTELKIDNLN